MVASAIDIYRREIEKKLEAGNATEHTHRSTMEKLIESLAPTVTATNEPKRVACGAPDFVISRKAAHGAVTVGYIEAKDVGKSLDEAEGSNQMKRYLPALTNLVLTDYLEFRWYEDGERRLTARLARVGKGSKLIPEEDGPKAVCDLLEVFLFHETERVSTAKELALRMARLTHFIRDMIVTAFEKHSASATLLDLHEAFERALIPDLPIPQFADMFAQSLAYGLFAARVNHRGPRRSFRRLGAAAEIPKTNPFLRRLFETITGTELDDEPFAGFVDDLAQLLADTEMDAVLEDFGKRAARQDPVVHFYETFLAAYDPKLREARGVYYTPEPVVFYIVRSVDHLLKTRFGCPNGLADYRGTGVPPVASHGQDAHATMPRVLVLDPACGTGTFLYAVVDHIRSEFMRQGNAGLWSGYVRSHLLPRIFGFELLMAPYAVAHFKLGMQLAGHDLTPAQAREWGYDFASADRLGVYLTNTLEEAERKAETLFGPLRVISEEANAASRIKQELPILAVIGNPPYSGHSANRSWEIGKGKKELTFIGRLIQDYYRVDGEPLGEKNPKWLQDDYVKFIRWGQWRIENTGAGILAFITNHGYLDNPTFRGMRQQLMAAFSEIYVLNLHGNSKKKERCPDGSPDENVFDIQQGVTIGIFVRDHRSTGVPPVAGHVQDGGSGTGVPPVMSHGQDAHATPRARVFHADLWGPREAKYEYLLEHSVKATRWKELSPRSPAYLFIPQEKDLSAEYEKGWKITDVMPVNVLGFQSHRDDFAIDFDGATLRKRIDDLRREAESDEELRSLYGLRDGGGWSLSAAREKVRADRKWTEHFIECLYRPFDRRTCYFSTVAMDRPRRELLDHVAGKENLCLNTVRQTKMDSWQHAAASDCPTPAVYVELKDGSNVFPLYLYPRKEDAHKGQSELGVHVTPWSPGKDGRIPNLNPEFIAEIEKRLGLKFAPDGARGTGVPPVMSHGQDAHATLRVRHGAYLPHWTREGAIYAVCFRLGDSLPQSAIETWKFERENIIKTASQMHRPLTTQEEKLLEELFSERVEKFLDEGRGACWMQKDEVAALVASTLKHFDGQRYRLAAWCVMPNHVHAVVQPLSGNGLSDILHSWKSFSSKEANRMFGRSGQFWQPEYYDHLIRNERDFIRHVDYVLTNPQRSGLKNWKWVGSGTGVPPVMSHGQDAHATVFGPEDVFNYIYAVFHSATYRTRYAEFLKSDFPRVPLTSDRNLFRVLCQKGMELVALHLLESPKLESLIARYPVKGSNLIEKGFPKYAAPGEPEPDTGKPTKEGRVYINRGEKLENSEAQYFEGVPPEVWNFHVGGYQICEKWLKDRRGRTLSYEDLDHYSKVVTALQETIRLMAEIDVAIPQWPLE